MTERNRHFKTQIAARGSRIMTTGRNFGGKAAFRVNDRLS